MAQSSNQRSVNPRAIIGLKFCDPDSVVLTRNNGGFTARNVKGKDMFTINDRFFTLHGHRVLMDANKNPLLTLPEETRREGQVFKLKNPDTKKLLFSVKKSGKSERQLDVFLDANKNGEKYDFSIQGKWSDQSCVVSRWFGDSPKSIAKMYNNNKMTVNKNVDYAFIVALVVLLEEIDP